MKKWRVIGWILALVIVLALVIYHLPVKRTVSMPVCNGSGVEKQLNMELKFYRHLIGGTTVKGTLVFDGEEYMDHISLNKTLFRGTSKGQNRWWKSDGLLNTNFWLVPAEDTTGVIDLWNEAYSQQVYFAEIGPGLDAERVFFFYTDMNIKDEDGSSTGVPYFGPAKTAEEAEKVAEEMGYEFRDGKVHLQK